MPPTYPVLNPMRDAHLGIGPISDNDIASLQEYADFVLNDLFFSMSADSQMSEEPKKNECIDLIEDAKRDRETSTYLAANNCLDEAREVWVEIAEIEQAAVEEREDRQEPTPEEPPESPAPPPQEEKPQGFGTMGWILIGGAAILLVGAVASASSK